jgi:hypothetical protein
MKHEVYVNIEKLSSYLIENIPCFHYKVNRIMLLTKQDLSQFFSDNHTKFINTVMWLITLVLDQMNRFTEDSQVIITTAYNTVTAFHTTNHSTLIYSPSVYFD